MTELIQVSDRQIGSDTVQSVDARDLHAFLEVGKDFSTWIKVRIEQYSFAEGQDFVSFDSAPQNGGAGNRGIRVEYALSLDMAKELAMVERNDRGKQARQYFIECERRAKSAAAQATNPGGFTRIQLLQMALKAEEERAALESQVVELKPKAEALDRIADANGSSCITNAAKALQVKPNQLFSYLRDERWIYKRTGGAQWLAYQDKIDQGLLDHKLNAVRREDGSVKVVERVLVKPKGIARLSEIFTGSSALQKTSTGRNTQQDQPNRAARQRA